MLASRISIFVSVLSGLGYGIILISLILILFSDNNTNLIIKYLVLILSISSILLGLFFSIIKIINKNNHLLLIKEFKSSWIARKIIFSILSLLPIIVFFYLWIFNNESSLFNYNIYLTVFISLIILFCTSMIGLNVSFINIINNSLIPVIYLFNSLLSGAIVVFYIYFTIGEYNYFLFTFLKLLLTISFFIKILYWFKINKFVLNKDQKQLFLFQRYIATILAYILPIYILWNTPSLNITFEIQNYIYFIMVLFFIFGIFIERNLFFLETKNMTIDLDENKIF